MFSLQFLCSRPWSKAHFYNKGDEFNRRLTAKWKLQTLILGKVKKASLHYLRNGSERVLPEKEYRQEILQVCREIAGKKNEGDFSIRTERCAGCPFAYMCRRD